MICLISFCFQVLDFVPIDCTKNGDIDTLLTLIKKEVLNTEIFPNLEQTLPRCYYEVENDIQDLLEKDDIPEHGQFFFVFFLRLQCFLFFFS